MLSKNNKQEKTRKLEEKNNRFSIRKFTVGTASVLIGAFFMGVSGTQTVHAADTNKAETTVDVNSLTQAPSEGLNSSLSLDDDLGLGDLLSGFNNYKQAQPTSQGSKSNTDSQVPDESSTKQDQGSDLDDDLNKLINDANKVNNQNTSTNSQEHKTEVKNNTRTVIRTVDVYLPGVDANDDSAENGHYFKTLNMDDMAETQVFIDGKKSSTMWQSKSYQAMSLADALKGNDWTLTEDGTEDHTLPQEDGWTPQIAKVTVDALGGTEGIFEQAQYDEAKKLQAQLSKEITEKPYEIPAYTISSPLAVTFDVSYVKDTPVKAELREGIDVTLPTTTDPDEDYYYDYKNINPSENSMDGLKSADGSYSWTPTTHSALDLNTALSGSGFVYAENGSWNNTLPSFPDYRAKITGLTAQSASPADDDNEAEVDELMDELEAKIAANPYEIPEYTTTTPINIYFSVEYEEISKVGVASVTESLPEYKGDVAGIPLTESAVPEYKGGVAGIPLTEAVAPEYKGGVAGLPLTESAAPEYEGGVAGIPLTEAVTPEYKGGVAGIPLTESAAPEYKGGVAGIPLTESAAPEYEGGVAGIPLTESTAPEYEGGVAGIPLTEAVAPEYKGGVAGIPLTESAAPEYEGGVAGIPLTESAAPEYKGGVAGIPLTESAAPEYEGGVAGIPLTEEVAPEYEGGVAVLPLTESAAPEYEGGVAGIPLTESAAPEYEGGVAGMPLTESTAPEYIVNNSSSTAAVTPNEPTYALPEDNNEDIVAPHANADETVENTTSEVAAENNVVEDTTAPVHSNENSQVSDVLATAGVKKDNTKANSIAGNADSKQNHAETKSALPQTGTKTTMLGVLGLMAVGVSAVLGLAVNKKRKN